MSTNEPNRNRDTEQGKEKGMLEKIAHTIDPSGREISDEELIDPGANIPDDPAKREVPSPRSPGAK